MEYNTHCKSYALYTLSVSLLRFAPFFPFQKKKTNGNRKTIQFIYYTALIPHMVLNILIKWNAIDMYSNLDLISFITLFSIWKLVHETGIKQLFPIYQFV